MIALCLEYPHIQPAISGVNLVPRIEDFDFGWGLAFVLVFGHFTLTFLTFVFLHKFSSWRPVLLWPDEVL